jgi:hypothetical protein
MAFGAASVSRQIVCYSNQPAFPKAGFSPLASIFLWTASNPCLPYPASIILNVPSRPCFWLKAQGLLLFVPPNPARK